MKNEDIGFVQFEKREKNIIEAVWYYLKNGEKISGTGIVKDVFDNTFVGNLRVTYYDIECSETSKMIMNGKCNSTGSYYWQN